MADENNKSITVSRKPMEKLEEWVEERKASGDNSIPSPSNLVSRLIISFLIEVAKDPEYKEIEDGIRRAGRPSSVLPRKQ